MEIQSLLRRFIVDNFMHELDHQVLGDDDPLIEKGIIDSLGLIRLLSFLEERFGIQIEETEVEVENFRSLNALRSFIHRKVTL